MILFMRDKEFRSRVMNFSHRMVIAEEDCRKLEKENGELFDKLCLRDGRPQGLSIRLRDILGVPLEGFRGIASNQKLIMRLRLATKKKPHIMDKCRDCDLNPQKPEV